MLSDVKLVQETLFPSMASLQGALPPSGMIASQGVHNHFSIPSQVSAHPSAMPPSKTCLYSFYLFISAIE